MCEYCDLYDKHIATTRKTAAIYEEDSVPCHVAVLIWAYAAGLAVGAEAKNVYAATSAVNDAYNAGLNRGYGIRGQQSEDVVKH